MLDPAGGSCRSGDSSHQLLLRAGLVAEYPPAFIPTYLGIPDIAQDNGHHPRGDGQDWRPGLMLPVIQPAELWHETGRWFDYGDEMMKVVDRHGRYFALGPTQRSITDLVRSRLTPTDNCRW